MTHPVGVGQIEHGHGQQFRLHHFSDKRGKGRSEFGLAVAEGFPIRIEEGFLAAVGAGFPSAQVASKGGGLGDGGDFGVHGWGLVGLVLGL